MWPIFQQIVLILAYLDYTLDYSRRVTLKAMKEGFWGEEMKIPRHLYLEGRGH